MWDDIGIQNGQGSYINVNQVILPAEGQNVFASDVSQTFENGNIVHEPQKNQNVYSNDVINTHEQENIVHESQESQNVHSNNVIQTNEMLSGLNVGAQQGETITDSIQTNYITSKSVDGAAKMNESIDLVISSPEHVNDMNNTVVEEDDFLQSVVSHSTPLSSLELRRSQRVSKPPKFFTPV